MRIESHDQVWHFQWINSQLYKHTPRWGPLPQVRSFAFACLWPATACIEVPICWNPTPGRGARRISKPPILADELVGGLNRARSRFPCPHQVSLLYNESYRNSLRKVATISHYLVKYKSKTTGRRKNVYHAKPSLTESHPRPLQISMSLALTSAVSGSFC